ncbi:MAG: cyclic pyranopterin monophosphate synthase MoaC [Phycisphaerales bacterium]|jgi:cyclic pyranopterin phosphate synthase|nr:cyclic pyranopterin monophosphate synthase MoaC [Phycisphaerales bacterium]
MTDQLSHIDENGRASMVDVSGKPQVRRVAVAEGFFEAAPDTIGAILDGDLPKGEALAVARVAGITAAKMCDRLIPLCHPLPLDHVTVSFEHAQDDRIRIEASATVTARTGIEMEALTAVSIAALTLWDMTKAIDKGLRISGIRIIKKEKDV